MLTLLLVRTGFAFVYMKDDRDAEDAIRALDRSDFMQMLIVLCRQHAHAADFMLDMRRREFGYRRRRLRVEWAKVGSYGASCA